MEKKKTFYLKLFVSALFAGLVFGAFAYVLIKKSDITVGGAHDILCFACVGACAVFSLLFLKFTTKKVLVSLALVTNVVADYFLVLKPTSENQLIGVCIFCGVQFFYFLYTLSFCKGKGLKIFNIAIRVALCLLAYFIIPRYVTLTTLEMISVMYIINCVVTLLCLLLRIKKEWLLFLGLLLLLACDIFVGFTNGAVDILGISGPFVDIVYKYDIAFYCYIPAEFFIALSSVWAKKRTKK